MPNRDQIVDYCTKYLNVSAFKDYCVNGLQVEGTSNIKSIVFGVSLSEQLIIAAIKNGAQMIVVHHGIFGDNLGQPLVLKGILRNRIKLLLENDINLCGFHLPLDAHPQLGNNISICKALGIKNPKPFDIGFIGSLSKTMKLPSFTKFVDSKLATNSFSIAAGPKVVKKIAVISGGSSSYYQEAATLGADTFICGDLKESVVRGVEEIGLNLVNAGHYNSERFGVQNLAKLLKRNFDIETKFIEIPCSI